MCHTVLPQRPEGTGGSHPRQEAECPGVCRILRSGLNGPGLAIHSFMSNDTSIDTITAEHFTLTPAIRTFLEDNLERIRVVLAPTARLSVVVSSQGHKLFSAVFKAHVSGHDFVSHDSAHDLHSAVNQARHSMVRQVTDRSRKLLGKNRRARAELSVVTPPELVLELE